MIRAYDESYLPGAMNAVGAMLDYAVNSCGQDRALFFRQFISSPVGVNFGRGNVKYIAGLSGIELARQTALMSGSSLNAESDLINIGSPEFWTGWAMAYLQWALGYSFSSLESRGLSFESLYSRYPALHEADLSKVLAFAVKAVEENETVAHPLKKARKNADLSQKELSSKTGIKLRTLRAYEQGTLNLRNASSENLLSLCRALNCSAETILPLTD